jgi:HD superfamily phosphohydrolase YqeK
LVQGDEIQRTRLGRYAPHVLVTTLVLVAFPLTVAYRLSFAPFEWGILPTALTCTLTSLGLGRVGAWLWQRHPGSRDVVFDDLLLWGYARRAWNQRRVIHHADRLAKGLSDQEQLKTLQKLANSLERGDPYTHGHSDRVARHAFMIARTMKLPRVQREKVRLAAALHDVGKLVTPRSILTKPDQLTDDEYDIVKLHPGDGADLVAALKDAELTAMVRHHHERMDGTGYPERLDGAQIPLGARIISVADTFDAITSKRAYRNSKKHKAAIDILRKEAGTQLDGDVVDAFIAYYTGRKEIRLWLSITTSIPRLFATVADTAKRTALNATVVGSTSVALIGGATVLHGGPLSRPAPDQGAKLLNTAVVSDEDASAGAASVETDGEADELSGRSRNRSTGGGADSSEGDPTAISPDEPGTDDSPLGPGAQDGSSEGASGSGASAPRAEEPAGSEQGGSAPAPDDQGSGGGGLIDDTVDVVDDVVDDTVDVVDDTLDGVTGGGDSGGGGGGLIDDTVDVVDDTVGGIGDLIGGLL